MRASACSALLGGAHHAWAQTGKWGSERGGQRPERGPWGSRQASARVGVWPSCAVGRSPAHPPQTPGCPLPRQAGKGAVGTAAPNTEGEELVCAARGRGEPCSHLPLDRCDRASRLSRPVGSSPVQGTHRPRQLPGQEGTASTTACHQTEPWSTPRPRSLDSWTEGQRTPVLGPRGPAWGPRAAAAPLPGEGRWRGASTPS